MSQCSKGDHGHPAVKAFVEQICGIKFITSLVMTVHKTGKMEKSKDEKDFIRKLKAADFCADDAVFGVTDPLELREGNSSEKRVRDIINDYDKEESYKEKSYYKVDSYRNLLGKQILGE